MKVENKNGYWRTMLISRERTGGNGSTWRNGAGTSRSPLVDGRVLEGVVLDVSGISRVNVVGCAGSGKIAERLKLKGGCGLVGFVGAEVVRWGRR